MEPPEPGKEKERTIETLEQDLNDLRQGLTVVAEYYKDLEAGSKKQDASLALDEEIVKPLMEDELEFESIWSFHEEVLVGDAMAHVPCNDMYEAFVQYCNRTGRPVVDQEAFEFVFARMENPVPRCDRGNWIGYRLRSAKE